MQRILGRPAVIIFFKAFVSLGLLYFLFSRVDIQRLLKELYEAHISYLIIVLACYFIGQTISSIRWALLARPLGFQNSLTEFFVLYFIGMFFNLFAPSTIGGDIGRVYYLAHEKPDQGDRKLGRSMGKALCSVIADRTIGMIVLVGIGVVSLLIYPSYTLPAAIRYATFGLALAILLICLFLPIIRQFVKLWTHTIGQNITFVLKVYSSRAQLLAATMILSLVIHFINVVVHILIGYSLDLALPWSYVFILYPLVGIFMAIPISFNGIGLREGGYLFMLKHIGVDSERAVAYGLLWFIVVVVESIIGGFIFILSKNKVRQVVL